jgi:hypothetical protein
MRDDRNGAELASGHPDRGSMASSEASGGGVQRNRTRLRLGLGTALTLLLVGAAFFAGSVGGTQKANARRQSAEVVNSPAAAITPVAPTPVRPASKPRAKRAARPAKHRSGTRAHHAAPSPAPNASGGGSTATNVAYP